MKVELEAILSSSGLFFFLALHEHFSMDARLLDECPRVLLGALLVSPVCFN